MLTARPAPLALVDLAAGEKLEAQGAGDRGGFHQPHGNRIAQPIGFSAAVADQRMAALVEAKEFIADGARRNEAVGAGLVQLDEESRAGDAADAAFELRPDAVGEEMRDQPV